MFRLCAIVFSLLPGSLPATSLELARSQPLAPVTAARQIEQRLAPLCAALETRLMSTPAPAPSTAGPHATGCGGGLQAGRPRKLELVFHDNRLDLAWVLFPAQARQASLQAFATRYGEPALRLEVGGVYLAARARLRHVPLQVPATAGEDRR